VKQGKAWGRYSAAAKKEPEGPKLFEEPSSGNGNGSGSAPAQPQLVTGALFPILAIAGILWLVRQ
jgi:hypothetical protein